MIINKRLGFATNSSSTHSVVIGTGLEKDEILNFNPFSFGWEFFTLQSREAKIKYISVVLLDSIRYLWDSRVKLNNTYREAIIDIEHGCFNNKEVQAVVEIMRLFLKPYHKDVLNCLHLEGNETPEAVYHKFLQECANGYVDHSSDNAEYIHVKMGPERFKKVVDQLLDEKVLILGGNDNSSEDHKYSEYPVKEFSDAIEYDNIRFDPDNKKFIWFDVNTGERIIAGLEPSTPIKTSYPLLVDLNVTDKCGLKCQYCYRSCDDKGEHASFKDVTDAVDVLADAGTLEVAIGGGDVLEYPHILKTMAYCRESGIVPNLSIAYLPWQDKSQVMKFLHLVHLAGSIGVSVGYTGRVKEIKTYCDKNNVPLSKFVLHIIPGVVCMQLLEELLELAWLNGLGVLLLGYKHVGKGVTYKALNRECLERWPELLYKLKEENKLGTISVDTAAIQKHEEALVKLGVSSKYYIKEEGKVSCFIDPVKKLIAPSSYSLEVHKYNNVSEIMHIYKTF